MNLFIGIFKFIGLSSLLAYCISYYMDFSYLGMAPIAVTVSCIAIIVFLKLYWFYQLNFVRKRQKINKNEGYQNARKS